MPEEDNHAISKSLINFINSSQIKTNIQNSTWFCLFPCGIERNLFDCYKFKYNSCSLKTHLSLLNLFFFKIPLHFLKPLT